MSGAAAAARLPRGHAEAGVYQRGQLRHQPVAARLGRRGRRVPVPPVPAHRAQQLQRTARREQAGAQAWRGVRRAPGRRRRGLRRSLWGGRGGRAARTAQAALLVGVRLLRSPGGRAYTFRVFPGAGAPSVHAAMNAQALQACGCAPGTPHPCAGPPSAPCASRSQPSKSCCVQARRAHLLGAAGAGSPARPRAGGGAVGRGERHARAGGEPAAGRRARARAQQRAQRGLQLRRDARVALAVQRGEERALQARRKHALGVPLCGVIPPQAVGCAGRLVWSGACCCMVGRRTARHNLALRSTSARPRCHPWCSVQTAAQRCKSLQACM
jgi:hypothetical protein